MGYSSQYGPVFIRTPENMIIPYWNNPNSTTWIKRMLPNGGNKNRGNIGITGKRFEKPRLSKLVNLQFTW